MTREKKFSMETLQDRQTICKYLEALKDGFQNGRISLSNQDEILIVEPGGLIHFSIKARKKDDEIKLSINFRWEEQD